jgi:hypothetical protein
MAMYKEYQARLMNLKVLGTSRGGKAAAQALSKRRRPGDALAVLRLTAEGDLPSHMPPQVHSKVRRYDFTRLKYRQA